MICEKHHTFDFNKSGYLYLYQTNKANHGDNQEMVQARTDFLSTGAYAFLKEELVRHTHEEDIIADLACGEGYYTCCLSGKEKYGLDLSKEALRHAARQDKTTQYILSSIFELPFEDNSFYLVVFDPPHLKGAGENSWMAKKYGSLPKEGWEEIIRDGFTECMRVLKPNGTLIFKWNETDIPTKKINSSGTRRIFRRKRLSKLSAQNRFSDIEAGKLRKRSGCVF